MSDKNEAKQGVKQSVKQGLVKNYDDYIPKNLIPKYIQKTKYSPAHPFLLLMVGGSGSGKTNVLLNLIFDMVYWEHIYIYAKDLSEPKYMMLKQQLELIQMVLRKKGSVGDEPMFHMSDNLAEVVDIDTLKTKNNDGSTRHNLIIFDDFLLDRDQTKFEEYFMRGRKKGSVIYLSQSYFATPRFIRLNAMYYYFFGIANSREMKMIASNHATDLTLEQLEGLFKMATAEKFSFFQIDLKTDKLPLKYRKNFTGLFKGYIKPEKCDDADKNVEGECDEKPVIVEGGASVEGKGDKKKAGRPREGKIHQCVRCKKTFDKPRLLKRHMERKFPCKATVRKSN